MSYITTEQLISALKGYIDCAFINEEDFLKTFWSGLPGDMLTDLYMGDEKIKYTIMTDEGSHIGTTIEIDEYLEWCESMEKSVELTKEQDDALWRALEKSTTLITR